MTRWRRCTEDNADNADWQVAEIGRASDWSKSAIADSTRNIGLLLAFIDVQMFTFSENNSQNKTLINEQPLTEKRANSALFQFFNYRFSRFEKIIM